MVQLNNTTKGIKVFNGQPLNEQQKIELNGHVEALPIIEQLKENDEQLLQGQQDIEKGLAEIDGRLDDGADQFKHLWSEVSDMKNSLEKFKEEFQKGIKEVIAEVKDQKISDLKNELSDRKSSDKTLKNDLIKIAVVTVVGALGYLFIKSYG